MYHRVKGCWEAEESEAVSQGWGWQDRGRGQQRQEGCTDSTEGANWY